MSFKKTLSLTLAGILFFAVGCARLFENKKPKQESLQLDAKTECTKNLGSDFEAFFDGKASDVQVQGSFSCIRSLIEKFESQTAGANENGYSPQELKKFFEKKGLLARQIPDDLVVKLMQFKKFWLGGEENIFLRSELKELQKRLLHIEQMVLQMKGLMPFSLNEKTAMALSPLIQYVLVESPVQSGALSLEKTLSLAESLVSFLSTNTQKPSDFNKYLPLVRRAILVLMKSETYQVASAQNWNFIADILKRGLVLAAHLKRDAFDGSWRELPVVTSLQATLAETVLFLQFVMENRDREIPFERIDDLLAEVMQLKYLPEALTFESLKITYRTALGRLFDPQPGQEKKHLSAIQWSHLQVLKREILLWSQIQTWITENLTGKKKAKLPEILAKLWPAQINFSSLEKSELAQDLSAADLAEIKLGYANFGEIVKTRHPIQWTDAGEVEIVSTAQKSWSWGGLSVANALYIVLHRAFAGYSEDPKRAEQRTGLKEIEVRKIYEELRPLGLELKAMDPRSANSGTRSFNEGNIFAWSGNGDDLLQLREMLELLSLLYSGGFSVTGKIYRHADVQKCLSMEKDPFGKFYAHADCFQGAFRENFGEYLISQPRWVAHSHLSAGVLGDQLFGRMWPLFQTKMSRPGLVETADIRTAVCVLGYIEIFFDVYDADRSGTLNQDEVMRAYPRFSNFLLSMMPEVPSWVPFVDKRDLAPATFRVLLFEGHKPTATEVIEASVRSSKYADREVNRTDVLNVFKAIANP